MTEQTGSLIFLKNAFEAYSLLWFFSISVSLKTVTNSQKLPPQRLQHRHRKGSAEAFATHQPCRTVQLGQLHLKRTEREQLKLPHWCSYRYDSCRYAMRRKIGGVVNRYGSCVITDEGRQHWLVYKLEN